MSGCRPGSAHRGAKSARPRPGAKSSRWLPSVLAGLLVACPLLARAELYRWTDGEGRVHVTDDLSRVPPEHRALATVPRASDATWNRIEPPASAEPPAPGGPERAARRASRHVIPVQRAGLELSVVATLNDRSRAWFKVDTGATINTIPRRVVKELGIAIDDSTPVTVLAGISGTPVMVPIVTVGSVSLRGAVVHDVEMAVLDTLDYGLLGMPYFNHFLVSMDPSRGALTLDEIDLDAVEGVYGGYGEGYWRARFHMLRDMLTRVSSARQRVPSTHATLLERVDRAEQYWRGQLADLETRASRAGVPRAWRE
jgi:hypothetical protein